MRSRRDVLRTGAGVVTIGGLTGLAGCSSVPVVGDDSEDTDSSERSETESSDDESDSLGYTQWVYDPDEMDSDSMSISLADIDSILSADAYPDEDKSNLRDSVSETFEGELEAAEIDSQLSVGYSAVVTGSFDPSDVLDAMSLSDADGYDDFDVYENDEDETTYFATDGDFLIVSESFRFFDHDGREELEVLIDTYGGDTDRFTDTNDDFELLTDELGSGDIVTASGRTEAAGDGTVADGFAVAIDGEETSVQFVAVYEDEDAIDLDEIEREIESERGENVEVGDSSRDGRVVTVDYSVPTEELVN